jgi:hypothetical protein
MHVRGGHHRAVPGSRTSDKSMDCIWGDAQRTPQLLPQVISFARASPPPPRGPDRPARPGGHRRCPTSCTWCNPRPAGASSPVGGPLAAADLPAHGAAWPKWDSALEAWCRRLVSLRQPRCARAKRFGHSMATTPPLPSRGPDPAQAGLCPEAVLGCVVIVGTVPVAARVAGGVGVGPLCCCCR